MGIRASSVQVRKNVAISVFAQVVSLAVSFIMNLVLPKYISEYQYAYWQIYLLYIGYVGVLHFGLLDGIVLRYSQYDYEELDKPRIRSQFKILVLVNIFLCLFAVTTAGIYCTDEMKIVFITTAVGIITRNLFVYTSYFLQITNRIHNYALMVISYRVFYGIAVCLLLLLGVHDFYWFCIADLCSDLFGHFVGAFYNRGLYLGSSIALKDAVKELSLNISAGIVLMVSNWSSFLLTGSARLIIQWHWNELTFGKVSYAFSITSLFLTFVAAASVVLFPSLKRADPETLPDLYRKIRNGISPFLVCILILYYPGCWLLDQWLPAYHQSLVYLGILLPLIVYASKVSLLTNNYLKAFRKEKKMLLINVTAVCLAVCAFAVSAYVFDNLNMLLLCIVGVLMFASIASEIEVMKIIGLHGTKDFVAELLMAGIFIFSATGFDLLDGFFIYFFAELVYLFFYRKIWKDLRKLFFWSLKKR